MGFAGVDFECGRVPLPPVARPWHPSGWRQSSARRHLHRRHHRPLGDGGSYQPWSREAVIFFDIFAAALAAASLAYLVYALVKPEKF